MLLLTHARRHVSSNVDVCRPVHLGGLGPSYVGLGAQIVAVADEQDGSLTAELSDIEKCACCPGLEPFMLDVGERVAGAGFPDERGRYPHWEILC